MTELLQEQVDRGNDADLFLRFIDEHKYFLNVLKEIEEELANSVLNLKPESKEQFTILQAQRMALLEPLKRIQGDKMLLDVSKEQPKGIL